jgi:hypothetical protein
MNNGFRVADGGRRRAGLTGLGAGIFLTVVGSLYVLGLLTSWIAVMLLFKGPVKPRVAVSLLVAALIGLSISSAKTTQTAQRAAETQRAELVTLEPQLRAAVDAGRWGVAGGVANQIRRIDSNHPALRDTAARIEAGLRREQVEAGIAEARKLVADPKTCSAAASIAPVWTKIKQVREDDPQWATASAVVPALERCRGTAEKTTSQALRKLRLSQRQSWAESYERGLLDKGIDAKVAVSGPNKDQVRIEFVLINRATVHQITDGGSMNEGGFLHTLQKAGYRRVTFADGYNESWFYTLYPEDERTAGARALTQMGLGQPLTLR